MKYAAVTRKLRDRGPYFVREGGGHEVWRCGCGRHQTAAPRHEASSYVVGKIGKQMPCLGNGVVAMTSTTLRTYTVEVFRDSDLWVIEVPELDVVGQARTLAGASDTARSLIARWLDIAPDAVAVTMDYSRIDPDAVALAAKARTEQQEAEALIRHAAASWRSAARRLVRDDGLSLRDAAAVLGVTYGRVQQLVRS